MELFDKKQIIVNSHERSGTHFLMNTLADNFGYKSVPYVNFDNVPNPHHSEFILSILKGINQSPQNDKASLIKSHYEGTFFKEYMEHLLTYYIFFYIYRDGKDTLNSCIKHFNAIKWNEGPRVHSIDEMMKAEPCGGCMRYQYIQYPTMWNRWEGHVRSWIEDMTDYAKERIVYIKFEDLRDKFDNTVKMIESRIDRTMIVSKPIKPDKSRSVQGGIFNKQKVHV